MKRYVIYLIGPEPDDVELSSGERQQTIHESDFCMQVDRFFSPGETLEVDEEVAMKTRSVRSDRGSLGIAYGTRLRAVDVGFHGKKVVFEEVEAP